VYIKQESLGVNNYHASDKLFITYKHSTVSMDAGYLFENKKKVENIKISNYVPDQVPNTKENLGYSVIYNVEIDADHFRTVTYVRFQKIQEALATIGGIISIIKLFFTIILMGIYDFSFPLMLFREVYLNGEEKIKLDKNRTQQNLINLQNIKCHSINVDNNNNFQYSKPPVKHDNLFNIKKPQQQNHNIDDYNNDKNAAADVIMGKNVKVIKLDINNNKNNVFGSKYKSNEGENAAASSNDVNIIKPDVINYSKNKNNTILESENNAINDDCNNNNNIFNNKNYTFNNIPGLTCDKNNNFNSDLNQVSKSKHNRELINNDNFRSSKRKLHHNPSSVDNIDLDNNRKKTEINRRNNIISENEEDYSNNRIISTNANNKELEILNTKKNNPIDILRRDFNKKRKANSNQIDFNNENEINTNKANNFNTKIMNREENEPNRKNKNKNKIVFKINFFELVSSICCRRKQIYEPLNIILEKIDKEIEIKSYLRLREDIFIMKDLLFDPKAREIFNNPYDFEEIYYSIKQSNDNEKDENRMTTFYKNSFVTENNRLARSKTNKSKIISKFTEKFKSLGNHINKLIK